MGFPSICYSVILPQPLLIVFHFFYHIKLGILLAFAYLGISPLEDYQHYYPLYESEYNLSPFSTHLIDFPALIKGRLPVVDFASFSKGLPDKGEVGAQCPICMGKMKARHQVRELGNCRHAFHKGCIDKWVDKGQVTCPLCRACLLSQEKGKPSTILTYS